MMRLVVLLSLLGSSASLADSPVPIRSQTQALKVFHSLIGTWKGTGTPSTGTREQRDRGFWIETIRWQWQFKGTDAWLRADITKGKQFARFALRFRPKSDDFALTVTTIDKQSLSYTGKFVEKRLIVDRHDAKAKQTHRLVFSLLHANRHLYTAETRADGHTAFTKVYQVGATKQGVAFETEDKGIECIVSGGLGTMPVTHKGKTYHVCCTGCRDAFQEDPEKYIKEFEAKKKSKGRKSPE